MIWTDFPKIRVFGRVFACFFFKDLAASPPTLDAKREGVTLDAPSDEAANSLFAM